MLSKLFSRKIISFGKSQGKQFYSSTVKRIYEPIFFTPQNQNIANFSTLKNKNNKAEFKKSIGENNQNFSTSTTNSTIKANVLGSQTKEIKEWWNEKPFEKGTKDEIQTFLHHYRDGMYERFKEALDDQDGRALTNKSEVQIKNRLKEELGSSEGGDVLFNDVQALKTQEITIEFMVKLQLDKNKFNVGSPFIKPEGKDVPLVGRTETMKRILNQITNRRYHESRQLSVLTSVPQIGKTRILQEIPNYISDPAAFPKLDESFYPRGISKDTFIPLLITFQNGANIQDFESENPDFYFALRMLHRYFLENNGLALPDFFSLVKKSCYQHLSVEFACNIIIEHFRKTHKLSSDIPVLLYLAVNEVQKAFIVTCKKPDCMYGRKTHSYLRHIIENCRGLPYQIFPILAGVEENLWNVVFEYRCARAPIRIELVSVTKFFDLIANEKMIVDQVKIPKAFLENPKFRQNMILLSGIPGAIVNFLNKLTEAFKRDKNWNNISWEDALTASTPVQLTHQPISFRDLARSIVQVPVDVNQYSDKQASGLLFLQNARILLPLWSIYRFQNFEEGASKKEQIIQAAIIANLNSIWEIIFDYGSDCQHRSEWFGANFYALKYNCHLLLGKKELTFGEFHNGAIMNYQLASKIIQLGDQPLIFEKIHPPPFSSSTSFGTPNLNLENHHKVFQVEGQEGIDFFSILSCPSTYGRENHLFLDRKAMSNKILTTDGLAEIITTAENQVPKRFENDWAIGVFSRQSGLTTEANKRMTNSIEQDIFEHCYFVGLNEFENYYGTFFSQIAKSFDKVNFNDPLIPKAAMVSCMSGVDSKELNKIAELLIEKRNKQQLSLQVCKEILKNVDGKNYSEKVEFNTSKISWTFDDELA